MKRLIAGLHVARVHAEEKGHWIVAGGYVTSATFYSGHSAQLMAGAYGVAALLTTHASNARARRQLCDGACD